MKGPLAGSCSRPSRRRRKSTLQRAHSAVFTNRYQAPATYPASLRLTAPPCGIAKSLCTKPPLDELHNARRHLVCGNSCGIGHVHAVYQDALAFWIGHEVDLQRLGERRHGPFITETDAALQRGPGHRSIHRSGVHVAEAEALRDRARHSALPRTDRPVDRHDRVAACAWSHENVISDS